MLPVAGAQGFPRPSPALFLPGCWSRGAVLCVQGQAWSRGALGPEHGSGAGVRHSTVYAATTLGCVGQEYCLHGDMLPETAAQQIVQCKVKLLICKKCDAQTSLCHSPVCCRSGLRSLNDMGMLVKSQF